jgi:hypothetical protein
LHYPRLSRDQIAFNIGIRIRVVDTQNRLIELITAGNRKHSKDTFVVVTVDFSTQSSLKCNAVGTYHAIGTFQKPAPGDATDSPLAGTLCDLPECQAGWDAELDPEIAVADTIASLEILYMPVSPNQPCRGLRACGAYEEHEEECNYRNGSIKDRRHGYALE